MWIHENLRVFGDRLIDDKDRTWLAELLESEALNSFKDQDVGKKEVYNAERLVYGDFMDGLDADPRIYRQVPNLQAFVQKCEEYLEDYNSAHKMQMHLVMFQDACEHVTRISRVLRQPLGHCLLLGVGGSGRQSLSRLASFFATFKLFQIEVVKGYNM